MKKFILGLVVGLILSASVAYASDYVISQNQFPVFVNGTQQEVEALNINGSTWMRLGSVGKVLGASVLFDEVNKQVNITTLASTVFDDETITTESEAATLNTEAIARSKFTPDGLEATYSYMYNSYVIPCTDFNAKYESQGYRITKLRLALPVCLYKNNDAILENVEKVGGSVEYDYYVNTILPLIQ